MTGRRPNNRCSNAITAGVPKGSILGPICITHINEVYRHITSWKIHYQRTRFATSYAVNSAENNLPCMKSVFMEMRPIYCFLQKKTILFEKHVPPNES